MDRIKEYRQLIEKVLREYASVPYAHGEVHTEVVLDEANDHYLLVNVGWRNGRRVHGSLVHIDIIDGKIWIQRDGTEQGIANELVEAGVPKDCIVLGFRAPEVRPYPEFAVA